MTESKLIKRCLEKDKKAWDVFVKKYSSLIYWAIRKRLGASGFQFVQEDINNIFQEVFLSILKGNKLLQLKNVKAIPGWLAVIASNKTVDFMRCRIREDRKFSSEMPVLKDNKINQELYGKDLATIVGDIINTLSAKEKVIISLNLLEGRTHKEIANITGIAINTVSTIIARVKDKLKKELERKGVRDL